ncbi:scavenger receptor class F member 2-like isoform X1 [Haliotis rufescens]|uniref:scavenger receptor class F member 2-like isoform X1 n=1 Tax=Haliotis rufescens TaxID=6454 RepID=UPI001EAF9266|nr:scavenger receptor class F member 2-like isoform X1 [Haliotis rufescens]
MAKAIKAALILLGLFCVDSVHSQICGDNCLGCHHGGCTECIYGWYGTDCTEECQGCWYDKCEQEDGRCVQCPPGYHSNDCDVRCSLNCHASYDGNRYCDRDTGRCLEGCVLGRWGHQCDKVCARNCGQSSCHQDVGTCLLGCIDGWFGQLCDTPCPENCLENRCNQLRGYCGHCNPAFSGRTCNIPCTNCIDNVCTYNEFLSSVNCTKGCIKGWRNEDCLTRCSNTCADERCNKDGSCKTCRNGYSGAKCTERCEDECLLCEQKSGLCTKWRETIDIDETNDGQNSISQGCVTRSQSLWALLLVTICCVFH